MFLMFFTFAIFSGDSMTFEQLYYFQVVANLLNFTKAADVLYISQPTLSRHIAALENELGTRLLIRDNRQVALTTAGEILLEGSNTMLEQYSLIRQRIHQADAGISGELTVASMSLYYSELYNLFQQYHLRYPDVIFRLQFHDMGLFSEAVTSGKADVAIGYSMELTEETDEFEIIPLYQEHFVAFMSELHPYAKRRTLSMAELRDQHLLFLSQTRYAFVREIWEHANYEFFLSSSLHTTDSLDSIILQIRANPQAVTLLPQSAALENIRACAIVEISDLDSDYETVMVCKKGNRSPALHNFLEMVRDIYGDGPLHL